MQTVGSQIIGGVGAPVTKGSYWTKEEKVAFYTLENIKPAEDEILRLIEPDVIQAASQIASKLKQLSTYRIWQSREVDLKKQFWKERTFWSDGYFVCSTGDASLETIRKCIEEQG